jgi:hypothetical protein
MAQAESGMVFLTSNGHRDTANLLLLVAESAFAR